MNELISDVCGALLYRIEKEMTAAWINAYSEEINHEINQIITEEETKRAEFVSKDAEKKHESTMERYEQDKALFEKEQATYEAELKAFKESSQGKQGRYFYKFPPKALIKPIQGQMIKKYGFSYPVLRNHEVEFSFAEREAVTVNVKNRYRKRFIETRWHDYFEKALTNQIVMLNPEVLLTRFIERHPWLTDELAVKYDEKNQSIVSQYLYQLLDVKLVEAASRKNWKLLSRKELDSDRLAWNPIKEQWLKEYIEGFPLSKIEKFYINNHVWVTPKLEDSLSVSYRFSRIDVFRILNYLYRSSGKNNLHATEVDGAKYLLSPKAAPIHHTELKFKTPEEFAHFELLVVNVNSKENPACWVVVFKERNQWVAYVPAAVANKIANKLKPFFKNLTVRGIDTRENMSLSDLTTNAMDGWNAVVFSKILPWCIRKDLQKTPLQSYRQNVPWPLLMQEAMENCLAILNFDTKEVARNFQDRKPFTNKNFSEVKSNQDDHIVGKDKAAAFRNRIGVKGILNSLDEREIVISPDQRKITITKKEDLEAYFVEALNLIYLNPSLSYFEFPKISSHGINNDPHLKTLFDLDIHLRTILPSSNPHPETHFYPLECAARNRFLEAMNDDALDKAKEHLSVRRELWSRAGQCQVAFFRNNGSAIDLDFINEVTRFNNDWKKKWCDHATQNEIDQKKWQFAQISQMGAEGLKTFFKHLTDHYATKWQFLYQEPAPRLDYVLDVVSSLTLLSSEHIEELTKHIVEFGKVGKEERKRCAPLFNSLSLILPMNFKETEKALFQLVDVLQKRKEAHEDEVGELTLYNCDIKNHELLRQFLMEWLKKAMQGNILILPRIPALDREVFDESLQQRALKNLYQYVQNRVKNNQRKVQLAKMDKNTASIYRFVSEERALPFTEFGDPIKLAQEEQIWDGEDVKYPLAAQGLGIQQQLQQQEEQQQEFEVKEEEQVEEEYEYEEAAEVVMYGHSEEGLITRDNIEEYAAAKKYWAEKITPDVKKHSGCPDGSNLKDLFSLWVGSNINAANVIEKMQPEALYKIMENASKFRLSVAKDNLPPGFFLQYSPSSRGLILCFDSKKEKEDLHHRELLASEEKKDPQTRNRRNPFTVELYKSKEASTFRGDFRQFERITKMSRSNFAPRSQQTLWKFLATEEQDAIRIEQIKQKLTVSDADDALAIEQRYSVMGELKKPGTYFECLEELQEWAFACTWKGSPVASNDFISILFNDEIFTRANLKAFGQLFNEADIVETVGEQKAINSTERWLLMANQIFTHFGEHHFKIWKSRLLDPSANWAELLEEREVEAVTESLELLRVNPAASKIWWELVEAHGASTGHMRYSDLWNAYKVVVKYIEKNDLIFEPNRMISYLKSAENFNGQVFLDRFYNVLKNAAKRPQIRGSILQNIINHVDKIDWQHSGFYWASRYEGSVEWHESSRFTSFHPTFQTDKPSYKATWDSKEQVIDFLTHASRFVHQHMRLQEEESEHLKTILNELQIKEPNVGRLLIASLILGSEKISDLSIDRMGMILTTLYEEVRPEFINWLNTNLKLEVNVENKLELRLEDIAIFASVVHDLNLQDQLNQLPVQEAFNFMNACGRALQCYDVFFHNTKKETFKKLLQFSTARGIFSLPLMTDYPWLINDITGDIDHETWRDKLDPFYDIRESLRNGLALEAFREANLFKRQLRSIDFSISTNLPSRERLREAFSEIGARDIGKIENQTAHDYRVEVVNTLKNEGCNITNLGGYRFRKITEAEQDKVKKLIETKLKGIFGEQNLKLFTRLVENSLAVPSQNDNTQVLQKLVTVFAQIDNKNHYNELAPLLGLLISKSKNPDGSYRQYSVPQLINWLKGIQVSQSDAKVQHYGVDLLEDVLDEALKEDKSSLLNENLDYLQWYGNASLLHQVSLISKTSLPNQYKPVLVKMAIEGNRKNDFTFVEKAQEILDNCHKNKVSPALLARISELLIFSSKQNKDDRDKKFLPLCHFLTEQIEKYPNVVETPSLKKLWEEGQIKQIDLFLSKDKPYSEGVGKFFGFLSHRDSKTAYVRAILMSQVRDWENGDLNAFLSLQNHPFLECATESLRLLAKYYATEPNPSLELLGEIIEKDGKKSARDIIHHFESVKQALNPDGTSKRHYSVNAKDRDSLNRVLKGFKRKGDRFITDRERKKLLNLFEYMNSFSQVSELSTKNIDQLRGSLYFAVNQSKNPELSEAERDQASARMLAYMREILLRKSGMWANHTQMLALMYAALHNDDSLIHQVRTGEGKSIITIMRASYLALKGDVVDVFSAKDSLSQRDHEEFAAVLDGMSIPHNYIPASAPADVYHTGYPDGIGAVNYATMGNFSLFHSGHIWMGKDKIKLDPKNRVAFIDEADHVLRDEQTQFNHSDNRGNDALYNLDEWVYCIAYKYYKELMKNGSLEKTAEGVPVISRNEHLKTLCERIQAASKYSPKESRFLRKYIVPARIGGEKEREKRDEQLKRLMSAAHTAAGLKEGSQYCIRPTTQVVANGMVLKTRFAKVMIDNQVKDGSTYSDLVQQFLHVRLNDDATERGETPNFFVEPASQIALSQNAKYLLKKYYRKLEGCTGTAGNEGDFKEYADSYDIKHIIKLPTHEKIKTKFLPAIYSKDEEAQVDALAEKIIANSTIDAPQPILITCKDDIAVKRLYAKVKEALQKLERADLIEKMACDTNDQGKKEAEVVPLAGCSGAVTFSARLGRGTNIKPQSKHGLMVLRTYPAMLRIVKQELGRQGRNGAPGTCQDIINYREVHREYQKYKQLNEIKLNQIYRERRFHIEKKLEKHRKKGSKKWDWMDADVTLKNQYCMTQTTLQFRQELMRQSESYIRKKEYLIAALSGNIMDVLHHAMGNAGSLLNADNLEEDWLACRQKIEARWNKRLAGKDKDTDDVYKAFFAEANEHWQQLCLKYSPLDVTVLVALVEDIRQANGIIDEIVRQGETWEKSLGNLNWNPTPNDIKSIEQFHKQLLKLIAANHPDKFFHKSDKEKQIANDNVKKLTDFTKVKERCISRANANVIGDDIEDAEIPEEQHELNLDAKSGAIVVHSDPIDIEDKATHEEIDAVIEFYQQWLKGAELYYFGEPKIHDELTEEIYGEEKEKLNHLFETLYSLSFSSSSDIKAVQHRQVLFTAFKNLISNSLGAYCISCEELADTISFLSKSNDLFIHLSCIQVFFKHNLPRENRLNHLQQGDISKNDRLLRLTINIVSKRFVNTDGANETFDFIKNLSQVIRKEYWSVFDDELAAEIESIFACHPDVVELLTKSVNENDISYFIELIRQYKTSGLSPFDAQLLTFAWNRRKKDLTQYLTTKCHELDEVKGVVRPLFTMILDSYYDYLPENPKILPKIENAKVQNDFWNFLVERGTNKKKECKRLIESLSSQEGEDFVNNVLQPIFNLPPVLTLKIINNCIKFTPGKFHYSDFIPKIKKLTKAGEEFNAFLLKQGLVSSTEAYSVVPGKEEELKSWVKQFERLSLNKSEQFFSLAKEIDGIPLPILKEIAEGFREQDFAELQETFSTVSNFYRETQCIDFLTGDEKRHIVVTLMNPQELTRLNSLTEKLSVFHEVTKDNYFLDENTKKIMVERLMEQAFPHPLFGNLIQNLSEFQKIIDNSNLFKDTFGEHAEDISDHFNTIFTYSEVELLREMNRLNIFLQGIKKVEENLKVKKDFEKVDDAKATAFMHLYKAFIVVKDMQNKEELDEALEVVKKALQLYSNGDYSRLFQDFHHARKERESLMQYLHHGILDLGADFTDTCFELYREFSRDLLEEHHQATKSSRYSNLDKHQRGYRHLQTCYHKIIGFTRELAKVSTPPHEMMGHVKAHKKQNIGDIEASYQTYFRRQKKNYNRSFFAWKNKDRKRQAAALFRGLNDLANPLGEGSLLLNKEGEFYREILEAIWKTQKNILDNDTNKHNKKGYSRLYDITVQMFAKTAYDCLKSEGVSLEEKVRLQALLQEQLCKTFTVFYDKLSPNDALKHTLDKVGRKQFKEENFLMSGSIELKHLSTVLEDPTTYQRTPKHLRYLLDSLTCLVSLNGTEQEVQQNSMEMDYLGA